MVVFELEGSFWVLDVVVAVVVVAFFIAMVAIVWAAVEVRLAAMSFAKLLALSSRGFMALTCLTDSSLAN